MFGISIVENFVGSIDKYLKQNASKLKGQIVKMFDIRTEGSNIVGNAFEAVADIFTIFRSDKAKQIGADLISIFSDTFFETMNISGTLVNDLLRIITEPFIKNKDIIKKTFEGMLGPVSSVLGTIKSGVENTFSKMWEVYEIYVKPAVDNIVDGFTKIIDVALEMWNTHLKPVFDEWATNFSALWTEHLQPGVDAILEFVGKLVDAISNLWNNVLAPLIGWIIQNVVPVIAPILKTVGNVFMIVFGVISDVVKGIMKALGGVIDFISGIFTGDWSKAWEGIKAIFSGIWDAIKGVVIGVWNAIKSIISGAIEAVKGIISAVLNAIWSIVSGIFNAIKNTITGIWNSVTGFFSGTIDNIKNIFSRGFGAVRDGVVGVFTGIRDTVSNIANGLVAILKTPLNAIISLINGAISGVNRLKLDIPDWVPFLGGKTFGINIPKIPMLAQGGYVGPNQPQPVIIGDNKKYGEIVAPENKLGQLLDEAISRSAGGNEETNSLLREIIKLIMLFFDRDRDSGNIDNDEIAKILGSVFDNYRRNNGKLPFEV